MIWYLKPWLAFIQIISVTDGILLKTWLISTVVLWSFYQVSLYSVTLGVRTRNFCSCWHIIVIKHSLWVPYSTQLSSLMDFSVKLVFFTVILAKHTHMSFALTSWKLVIVNWTVTISLLFDVRPSPL